MIGIGSVKQLGKLAQTLVMQKVDAGRENFSRPLQCLITSPADA